MRRLLQYGTLMLLFAAFVTPLTELFDRWDPPGPSNDTELAVFGLVLALCLVLLVSKLVATLAVCVFLCSTRHLRSEHGAALREFEAPNGIFVPPLSPPPLRI